jgi:uncharacterized membrane protein
MGNFYLFWHSLSMTSSLSKVDAIQLQPEETDSEIEALKERAKNADSQVDTHKDLIQTENEEQLAKLLSNLLKYGVLLASAVVLFGGIIYLVHQWDEPAKYTIFKGEAEQFRSPQGIVKAVLAGSDRAIIQLGLLVLVAIPILRVIISLFAFLRMRNFIYVVITLLVLICLSYSLLGAYI